MVNVKGLETHIVEGERCQQNRRAKFFRQYLPQTQPCSESPTTGTPPNNIDVLVIHIKLCTRLRLTSIAFFNQSFQTSNWTLFASLNSKLLFGDNKEKGESDNISCSSSHNWLNVCLKQSDVLKQDETPLWQLSVVLIRKMWLVQGGFIFFFKKLIIYQF